MSLKWLFWTGLLSLAIFLGVVYFGIKYNWVSSAKPSDSRAAQQSTQTKPKVPTQITQVKNKEPALGNGVDPELIDEIDISEPDLTLGSSALSIEEIVDQCQRLSTSIGVPTHQLDQSISECIDRNSQHLNNEGIPGDTGDSERERLIREQCDVAITQKELLSAEEVKMLVDECVATMR